MRLKRIQGGVYETQDGEYRIERDGYEAIYTDEQEHKLLTGADARLKGNYHDGISYAPEEIVWIVLKGEQNLYMGDTLKDCKTWLEYEYKKERTP